MTGRLYSASDMAKVYCEKCNGCGECCHGMTDTIHLDPWDIAMLSRGTGKTFLQLLDEGRIALHEEDGLTLPHLRMQDGEHGACTFLSADGRCSIHPFRPGLCRLFPLGRDYDADTHTFRYFIVGGGCEMPGRMKVKISKWLGVPDLPEYEQYITEWHYYLKDVKAYLAAGADTAFARQLNLFLLKVFFETPYREDADFYGLFRMRLAQAKSVLS